jgi:hypothetical protein
MRKFINAVLIYLVCRKLIPWCAVWFLFRVLRLKEA